MDQLIGQDPKRDELLDAARTLAGADVREADAHLCEVYGATEAAAAIRREAKRETTKHMKRLKAEW
ncbi:MAG: hypothetical protein KIT09_02130 [Bryobacteraceae bacterium]|nr:hypothetical protein [Bryobacteraceae bacterium]